MRDDASTVFLTSYVNATQQLQASTSIITWSRRTGLNYSNTTKKTYRLSTFWLQVRSRIRQSWHTHKGGNMDQEDWQHESRRGELPVEACMRQAFTYWRPALEVSPDEGRWSWNVDKQCVFIGEMTTAQQDRDISLHSRRHVHNSSYSAWFVVVCKVQTGIASPSSISTMHFLSRQQLFCEFTCVTR